MNNKQKFALWIGILALFLLGLFPPWLTPYLYGGESLGFSPIFNPPHSLARPDISRITIGWATVIFTTAGLILTFRKART